MEFETGGIPNSVSWIFIQFYLQIWFIIQWKMFSQFCFSLTDLASCIISLGCVSAHCSRPQHTHLKIQNYMHRHFLSLFLFFTQTHTQILSLILIHEWVPALKLISIFSSDTGEDFQFTRSVFWECLLEYSFKGELMCAGVGVLLHQREMCELWAALVGAEDCKFQIEKHLYASYIFM